MKLSNSEAYLYAAWLNEEFGKTTIAQTLPLRLNYIIQFNLRLLMQQARIIETMRSQIGTKYGKLNSNEEVYEIEAEYQYQAESELGELMSYVEDFPIKTITFDELEKMQLTLTNKQMQALLFMISDNEE